MSKIFEPLNPREDSEPQQPGLFPDLFQAPDPLVGNLPETPLPTVLPSTSEPDPDEALGLGGLSSAKRESSVFKPGALENIGVNWATPEDTTVQKPFSNDPGFWNVDFDPTGKRGEAKGLGGVQAANVFGRQFTREQLMKSSEGRKLVSLMDDQRTGKQREKGFLSGLGNFSMSDVPFLGWMVDLGMGVGETIDMSKTMRKMQNGEKVTDEEAIGVRRYMLQQEIEGERGMSYQVGSIIHSSVPFMAEMAMAGAMIAASTKVGAAVGAAVGTVAGPGVGNAVGAVVGGTLGFLFGGGKILSKLLSSTGRKVAVAGAERLTSELLREAATKTAAEGFDRATRHAVIAEAANMAGVGARELLGRTAPLARSRALTGLGREAAVAKYGEDAVKNWTEREIMEFAQSTASGITRSQMRGRTTFESTKLLAENFQQTYVRQMDASIAHRFLVGGDAAKLFHYGLTDALETAALAKVGVSAEKAGSYWARKRAVAQGLGEMTDKEIQGIVKGFVDGTIEGAKDKGVKAIEASMAQTLGGTAGVNLGYAREIADHLAENTLKGFRMKYAEKGFVNGMHRFGRWFGDGALDGMLRWDTSMFGGMGTIARSESVLGGKMNVLKEALKASFVEAPVRGAMQLGMQVPLWPVAAGLSGHDPRDFAIRGQLGIQAQALRTGDTELMDHARAIAFGSGMVEYISENAGRGLNLLASGIAKPVAKSVVAEASVIAKDVPLVAATQEWGSRMARKVTSIFGTEDAMKAGTMEKVADSVAAKLGKVAAQKAKEGVVLPTVTRNEVMQLVKSRSAKGISGLERILRETGMTEKELITSAFREQLNLSKTRAGILYFTAYEMMRRGITPQKMSELLHRVGYDGILSEMAEERYGGFFQGLLGLNERPSDEGWKGRWQSAMEGLFPDKDQLVTEALGFAFPCVTQVTMNHLYRQCGQGIVQQYREAANGVNIEMRTLPTLSMPVDSPEYAEQVRAHREKTQEIVDRTFGTDEANAGLVTANAAGILDAVRRGAHHPKARNGEIAAAKDEEQMKAAMAGLAQRIIEASPDGAALEKQLADHDATAVFGKAGVEAIRNQWRKDAAHTDAAKEAAFAPGSEYAIHMENAPLPATYGASSLDDVVNRITLSLPSVSDDASMLSAIRQGLTNRDRTVNGVRVNDFGEDLVGETVRRFRVLADAGMKVKYDMGGLSADSKWSGARGALMRMIGIFDAITTGDLSLAARNPVQWAMEDAQLPKQTLSELMSLKDASIQAGRRTVLDGLVGEGKMTRADADAVIAKGLSEIEDKALFRRFVDAGERQFQESLRNYAQVYLAARNVLAVSRGDITDAALTYVAKREEVQSADGPVYRTKSGTVKDFRSEDFMRDHAPDIEQAKTEIVQALVRAVSDRAVAINSNGRPGNVMTTTVGFDIERACRYGTTEEIAAAIKSLPAFRQMQAVHDISRGAELHAGAFARTVELSEVLALPDDRRLDTTQLRSVMVAMGRLYGQFSEEENQRAAAAFVRRVKAAQACAMPVGYDVPESLRDGKGNPTVTVSFSHGSDGKGVRGMVATVVNNDTGTTESYFGATSFDAAQALYRATGIQSRFQRLRFVQSSSVASSDAVSMAVFLAGSREAAWQMFHARGLRDEGQKPPLLRKDLATGGFLYDENTAARMLRDEMDRAKAGDGAAKLLVEGDGVEGSPTRHGYETLSEIVLGDRGIRRDKLDDAVNTVAGGEPMYSVRFSGLPVGDDLYVSSDYYSDGDGEAMLRSALSQAIYNSMIAPGASHAYVMGAYAEADRAFAAAAETVATRLETTGRDDMARRVRVAVESLHSVDGRLSPQRLAAIASAMVFFSNERGVADRGNGYLLSPELALVADEARKSRWAPLFLSVVDEALGGDGLFRLGAKGEPSQCTGLMRLVDAFSPSGASIAESRRTAVFAESGSKDLVSFAQYSWSSKPTAGADAPIVSENVNVSNMDRQGVAGVIRLAAANCAELARAYKSAGAGDLDAATVYRMLKRADLAGGETSVGGAKPQVRGPKPVRVGSAVVSETGRGAVQQSSSVVSDEVAFAMGRSFRFLSPAVMRGVGELAGRAEAKTVEGQLKQFLFSRGMSVGNIERVVAQTYNAFGAGRDEYADEVQSDEDDRNEVIDETAASGNQELALDGHATDAAIRNRDMQAIGKQLFWIFPAETSNFSAIYTRLATEVTRLAAKDGASASLKELAAQLNVLRAPRSGKAVQAVGKAEAWADAGLTDAVLDSCVADLHAAGHTELAFALSAIRNLPAEGKRRAGVLRQVAFMYTADQNRIQDGALDLVGSAPTVARAAVESSIRHVMSVRTFGTTGKGTFDALTAIGAFLQNADEGSESYRKYTLPSVEASGLKGKTPSEFRRILAPCAKAQTERSKAFRTLAAELEGGRLSPKQYDTVVAFANDFAERARAVADAIDYLFGTGNELAHALRNPGMVANVVQSVRYAVSQKNPAASLKKAVAHFVKLYDGMTPTKSSACPAITYSLYNPVIALLRNAIYAKGFRPSTGDFGFQVNDINPRSKSFKTEVSVFDLWNAAIGYGADKGEAARVPVVTLASRAEIATPNYRLRDKWLANVSTISSSATGFMPSVFGMYDAMCPRATGRVSGERSDSVEDMAQVTLTSASPIVAALAVEDRLLRRLGVLEDYLGRGGRFEDGSRLVCTTVGAKFGKAVGDKALLSRHVCTANLESFLNDDAPVALFQLYHGEKPTVNSISLPDAVLKQVLADIHDGKDYTRNPVTKELLEGGGLAKSLHVSGKAERWNLYRALFSVVAKAARCDELDSKRTQLLMSQGIMFTPYCDSYSEVVDGAVRKVDCTSTVNAKTGEKVVPGAYIDICVSGADATQNLGMYFNSGRLVASQRSISTNPDAVSFKNHLTDAYGTFFMKGQSHDPGLGMRDTDLVWNAGVVREAQRTMRRRVEDALGLDDGILDLPDETQRKDAAYMEARGKAVEAAEAFLRHSTVISTDMETMKCGPFSARCGFAAEKEGDPIVLTVKGKEVTLRVKDGRFTATVGGKEVPVPAVPMPEHKNGAYCLALVIPAAMEAIGVERLKAEEIGEIESSWRRADGTVTKSKLATSGIFGSYGTEKGDRFSVEKTESGYSVRVFTRSFSGQIMANSDAPSETTSEHPAATNWLRDIIANAGRLDEADDTAVVANIVSKALPRMVLEANPALVREVIDADPALAAQVLAHPNSLEVTTQAHRRVNSTFAKALRARVNSAHHVLMGSGIKVTLDRINHAVKDWAYSAGVDAYDRDCFRPARIFKTAMRDAYGMARSYSSCCANVTGDPAIRYGWHLDVGAVDGFDALCDADPRLREIEGAHLETVLAATEQVDADDETRAVAQVSAAILRLEQGVGGKARKDILDFIGRAFTDYTGLHLSERENLKLSAVSFHDLVRRDGTFDFAAFEFGEFRKTSRRTDESGKPASEPYLGGSFFVGDRRPSGNFEAASGLARMQAPVSYSPDGTVGASALYILDPVQNGVQGSDTDGDSATGTVSKGRGATQEDRDFLTAVYDKVVSFAAKAREIGPEFLSAEIIDSLAHGKYARYFETDADGNVNLSQAFHDALGNVLVDCEIENYRRMPCEEQGNEDGAPLRSLTTLADGTRGILYDIGRTGGSPVGTDVVFGHPMDLSGAAAELCRKVTGKDPVDDKGNPLPYSKAFKKCIDAVSGKGVLNLLDPFVSAGLSAAAADANQARGVMVSIQAAIEHLKGFTRDDAVLRSLAPALYEDRRGPDGSHVYRPCEDFVAHLDGISNALFDVVKDLFAPRAGWTKDMLNYLIGRLLRDADAEYAAWDGKGTGPQWGNEWFFTKLVGYARDFNDPRSFAGTLRRAFSNCEEDADSFGVAPGEEPKYSAVTFLGLYREAADDKGSVLNMLAPMCRVWKGGEPVAKNGKPRTVSAGDALSVPVRDSLGNWESVPAKGDSFLTAFDRLVRNIRTDAGTTDTRGLEAKFGSFESVAFQYAKVLAKESGASGREAFMREYDRARGVIESVARILGGENAQGDHHVFGSNLRAVALKLLSAPAKDLAKAVSEADAELDAFRALDVLLATEDPLSPEATFARGGAKPAGLVRKYREGMGLDAKDEPSDSKVPRFDVAGNVPMRTLYDVTRARLDQQILRQYDPTTEARAIASDAKAIEDRGAVRPDLADWVEKDLKAEPLVSYTRDDAMAVVKASLLGNRFAKAGTVSQNREILHHLVGAVAHCHALCVSAGLSSADAAKELSKLVKANYSRIDGWMEELVTMAVRDGYVLGVDANGTRSAKQMIADNDIIDMLSSLRVFGREGEKRTMLAAKAGQAEAVRLRSGLSRLTADAGHVYFRTAEGEDITGFDLGILLRLRLCATQAFDSAADSNVRANVTAMFGDEVDEMERWGAAVPRSLVLRALCTVDQAVDGQYDLLAAVSPDARVPWADSAYYAQFGYEGPSEAERDAMREATPLDVILGLVSDPASHAVSAKEAAETALPGYRPGDAGLRTVESAYRAAEPYRLAPRTKVGGVRFTGPSGKLFDTLEDAVNAYSEQGVAELKASPQGAAALANPALFNRLVARRLSVTGAYAGPDAELASAYGLVEGLDASYRRNPYALPNSIERVIADTMNGEDGERFAEWMDRAAIEAGNVLDPAVHAAIRNVVRNRYIQTRRGKASVRNSSAAGFSQVTVARVKRGGLADFLRHSDPKAFKENYQNPFENIKYALEKAFGKWSKTGGVKVERPTIASADGRRRLPSGLIRITRRLKAKDGVKDVVTFISFGDVIPMDVASDEYLASMLEAINAGAKVPMTMEQLKAMTEEERMLLANSSGLKVYGESRSGAGLTTDALLAMSGLIRLSDSADFHTLFHEYFHQMLDFFTKSSIISGKELDELKAAYSDASGVFNEEKAANAFADYLTASEDDALAGKVLAAGYGDGPDGIFSKMKHTAQAFLAGALAYDTDGVPVFMKMLVTGDFSDRKMEHVKKVSRDQMARLVSALSGEEVAVRVKEDWLNAASKPLEDSRLAVEAAVRDFKDGKVGTDAVKAAIDRYAKELRKPENKVVFDGVLASYSDVKEPERPGAEPTLQAKISDPATPAVERVRLFLGEALKRTGRGTLSAGRRDVIDRLRTFAGFGMHEIPAGDVQMLEATCRRALRQLAEALGIAIEDADGNLTETGKSVVGDAAIAEFMVRLVHSSSLERKSENGYTIDRYAQENGAPELPAQYASADYVIGRALAGVLPEKWGEFCHGRAQHAADLFHRAAQDLSARAAAIRERFAGTTMPAADRAEHDRLVSQANNAEARARDVVRFADAVARGEDLHRFIPYGSVVMGTPGESKNQGKANLFGYVFGYVMGRSRPVRHLDGTFSYEGKTGSEDFLDYSAKHVQEALDAAARAFGIACVVRGYVIENGVGKPAAGAAPTLPADPVPPPVNGAREPDTTPQVILMAPGSWLASDLHRNFFGSDLRDIMTDVSLQAAVEETNRVRAQLDFYFGADVQIGDRAHEITSGTSDLGFEGGVSVAGAKYRHSTQRVSAVRGYLLGLVNRDARKVGRAFTQDDVNMVNFALQAAGCIACGDPVFTGYDVPWMSRGMVWKMVYGAAPGMVRTHAKRAEDLVRKGGSFSPEALANRVHGENARPSNLDVILERLVNSSGIPDAVLGIDRKAGTANPRGVFCRVLQTFIDHCTDKNGVNNVTDAEYRDRVIADLSAAGLAIRSSETGKAVLVIPTDAVKYAWNSSETRQSLVDAGRDAAMLDLDYAADLIAAEAARLHSVARKSRFLSDWNGQRLSSATANGLWFEAGTGHHGLVTSRFRSAKERFAGKPSADEQLRRRFDALAETLDAHRNVKVWVKHSRLGAVEVDKGDAPAFATKDGQLQFVSTRQLQFLGRLLGLGRRVEDPARFLEDIMAGNYSKSSASNVRGFDIRPDMTVFEFDRLIFDVVTSLTAQEALGHVTPLTAPQAEGGLGLGEQELIDLEELNDRLAFKLMSEGSASDKVRGRICSMSETQMFHAFGKVGSSKTGTERLGSMAESIVHAERFRGCLAQMLTTVGSDGTPNYVVKPADGAENLAPDEYWGALARFVIAKTRTHGGMVEYDASLSGIENMRRVADAASVMVSRDEKAKGPMRFHALPPDELGATGILESVLCRDDGGWDDANVLVKFTNRQFSGSEAAGYMRQLFGTLQSPSVWSGFRTIDRLMAYSKAASVGFSAFFAFATRFESPVAACGLLNTAAGYTKTTAKAAREIAKRFPKLAKAMGFEENLPYLADFLEAIASNDPAIRDMRELCDLINMPLGSSVQNPMTDRQGAIDSDIERISAWLRAEGHHRMAKEVRGLMKAALHNPSEYAFSNVLNGVKMAVVAQTMHRLRRECEEADRPFDPIRELRRHSAYINAEIGGIQPERYAWLTPGMQRTLRMAMFSYQWTLGAWCAGTGEVVSDLIFGGHNTTPDSRRTAFVRWLRMIGIVKVGIPVFLQASIKALALAIQKSGLVGDPDDPDDKDPLGVDDMPWLCFDNEEKVGSMSFDVTPLLRLCGRSDAMRDARNGRGAYPFIGAVAGAAAGAALTRSVWGIALGFGAGSVAGRILPAYDTKARGANTTGRRRYYMHFAKQNDEFWRWFTDAWNQATSKMSIPTQKVVEAFFGSTNGSNFGKKFKEKDVLDRFFTTDLDPNENALTNFLTAFAPFSAASVAAHPDAGVLGMMGPVQMGVSKTAAQKRLVARLMDFVEDDSVPDVWSSPKNRASLHALCADILREAEINGYDPAELLTSALGQVTSKEYVKLFSALPRGEGDTVDAVRATKALRALYRANRKKDAILRSIKEKYKTANIDWSKQSNAGVRIAAKRFLLESGRDPWMEDEDVQELYDAAFSAANDKAVRQAGKGGDALASFLATDEVPETLFGIPVVSADYTEEDLAFFRANPEAGGFYDMGDAGTEPLPPKGPGGPGGTRGAIDAGEVKRNRAAILDRAVKGDDGTFYKTANDAFKAKFAEISHPGAAAEFRRSALDALDRDAKAPWLRAEYARIAKEETGPLVQKGGGDVDRFVELSNKDLGKLDGNGLYKMLGVSPLEGHVAAPAARKETGFLDKAKEAASVAKDLVETVVGGYGDASTLSKKDVNGLGVELTGAADLARQMERNGLDSSGVEVQANGEIINVKTGKPRAISDADRRSTAEYKKEIGLREDAKGGETFADRTNRRRKK